jgi:tetratricopeptide (TPR) repeat protein
VLRPSPKLLAAVAAAALAAAPALGTRAWASKASDAEAAFAANQDDDAVRLFSEAIAESANDPSAQAVAYFGRGEVQAINRRYDLAVADFTAALALHADDASRANTLVSRAEVYGRQRKYDEALADYAESLRLAPGAIGVHYARGALLRRLNRIPEAVSDFDAELKINPTSYRTTSARAEALGLPIPELQHRD